MCILRISFLHCGDYFLASLLLFLLAPKFAIRVLYLASWNLLGYKLVSLLFILTTTFQMDGNFYIYTDLSALPVDEHEAYLAEGFGGVCTGGTAVIEVFSVSRQISKNDLVTVLPLQSVLIREVSPDFSMTFFKIDKTMFLDTMSSLGKITPDFFFYMVSRRKAGSSELFRKSIARQKPRNLWTSPRVNRTWKFFRI